MEDLILKTLAWVQLILLTVLIIGHIILGYEWLWFSFLYLPSIGLMLTIDNHGTH